jgi:hypothetical protein
MDDSEKLRVLLGFWVQHNLEHAEEFIEWARRAESLGCGEAASKLETAAQEMRSVNNSLEAALDSLGGALEGEV